MANIAIVGSRRRMDQETVARLVERLPADAVVVSGGAPGPDTWAEEAAVRAGLPTKIFRPNVEGALNQGQRRRRFHARNQLIVDAADELIALVSPNRRGGTEDTIARAQRKGIPVRLVLP